MHGRRTPAGIRAGLDPGVWTQICFRAGSVQRALRRFPGSPVVLRLTGRPVERDLSLSADSTADPQCWDGQPVTLRPGAESSGVTPMLTCSGPLLIRQVYSASPSTLRGKKQHEEL